MGKFGEFAESMLNKAIENKSLIFGVVSVAGTVATLLLTMHANKKIREKGDDATTSDKAKAYAGPIAVCAATVAVDIAYAFATDKNAKSLAPLALTGALYGNRILAEQKAGVKDRVSAALAEMTDEPPETVPSGYELYYSEFHKCFFVDKYENILDAHLETERIYQTNGKASINCFFRALNNEKVPPREDLEILQWAKWHTTKVDSIPPLYIELYPVPMKTKTGQRYSFLEFPNPPEPDCDCY